MFTPDKTSLESMIDAAPNGLQDVLDAIAEICDAKGDHVRENWQDETQAKQWELAARFIERLSNDFKLKGLPL